MKGRPTAVALVIFLLSSSVVPLAPGLVPDIQEAGDLMVATWDLDSDENLTLDNVSIYSGGAVLSRFDAQFNVTGPSGFTLGTLDNLTIGPTGLVLDARPDWWDRGYKYRMPIDIHNKDGTAREANFTVNFTLDTASLVSQGKMQASADDLRIVYDNGTVQLELDRLVENANTSATKVWFRTQDNISASSWANGMYYLYYQNLNAVNPPQNESNVYLFFDSFAYDTVSDYNITGNMQTGDPLVSSVTHDPVMERLDITSVAGNTAGTLIPNVTAKNVHIEAIMNMTMAYNNGPREAGVQMVIRGMNATDYYYESFANLDYDPEMASWVGGVRQAPISTNTYRVPTNTNQTVWMSVLNNSINGGIISQAAGLSGMDAQITKAGFFGAGMAWGDGYIDDIKAWYIAEQMPVLVIRPEESSYNSAGTYTSEAIEVGSPVSWDSIEWSADLPTNTAIIFNARVSNDTFNWTPWSPDLTDPSGEQLDAHPELYIQICATLTTTDTEVTPTLYNFSLNYSAYVDTGTIETDDLLAGTLISWKVFSHSTNGTTANWSYSVDSGFSWDPVPAMGNLSGVSTNPPKIRFKAVLTTMDLSMSPIVNWFNVSYTVNKSPTLIKQLDPVSFPEDTSFIGAYNLSGHFEDDSDITYSARSMDMNLTVTVHSNGTVDLVPAANWSGETDVTFEAEDGYGAMTEATINVTVTPVNDLPVIVSEPQTRMKIGENFTYQVVAEDVDGDTPFYHLDIGPVNMTLNATNVVRWKSDEEHIGANPVSIRVTDGITDIWQNFTLVVERDLPNNLPNITNEPEQTAYVGLVYKYQIIATDADGDVLRYWLDMGPTNMTVDQISGLLTWTPAAGEEGNVTVIIKVSDPFGSVLKEFVIEVFPEGTNTPPTIGTIDDVTVKGKPVIIVLSDHVSDPDEPSNALIWRIEDSTAGLFTAEIIGTELRITPIEGEKGEGTIHIVVRDSGGLEDDVTIGVVVKKKATVEPGLWDAIMANCLLFVTFLIILIVVILFMFVKFKGGQPVTTHVTHVPAYTTPTKPVVPKTVEEVDEEEQALEEAADIEAASNHMERVFNTLIKNRMIEDDELKATLKGAAKKVEAVKSATLNEYEEVVLEPMAGVDLEDVCIAYGRILDMALRPTLIDDGSGEKRKKVVELASTVLDGEMDRGALVLGRSILKGAMAERLQTGVPGFDELLGGGFPKGSAILVQMPIGAEKDLIMMQLAKAGMVSGQGVLVTLSDSSPEQFYGKFENVSVRPEVYAEKGGLRIVDWNTYKTKRVRDVEEDGAVIRSSKGITNLGIAITDAGQALMDEVVKRAVIDVVSSAVKIFGMDTGYRFVQTMVAKLKEMDFTTVFIVDKDMHEDEELGTISQTFDGVVDIERTREGKRIVTEIMVLSMSKPGFSSDVKIIEITDRGLVVKDE